MKKFLLILLPALCNGQGIAPKNTADSTLVKYNAFINSVNEIKKEVNLKIDSTKALGERESDNARDINIQTSHLSARTQNLERDVKKMETQINTLEESIKKSKVIDSLKSESRKLILKKRYQLASNTILEGMIRGVTFVKSLSKFTIIEHQINITTSVWQDKDLKNGFDKLKDYTGLFGLAGVGIPLLNNNSNSKTALISGASAMLLPQVISWIGKSNKKVESTATKIQSKVELLTLSRNAYDDLFQRKLELEKIYVTDTLLLNKLYTLQKSIKTDKAPSDSTMNNRIFEIQEHLNKFNEVQRQIPSYLLWTKDIVLKYKTYSSIYSQIKIIERDIDNFLATYHKDFETIVSIPLYVRRELFNPTDE